MPAKFDLKKVLEGKRIKKIEEEFCLLKIFFDDESEVKISVSGPDFCIDYKVFITGYHRIGEGYGAE